MKTWQTSHMESSRQGENEGTDKWTRVGVVSQRSLTLSENDPTRFDDDQRLLSHSHIRIQPDQCVGRTTVGRSDNYWSGSPPSFLNPTQIIFFLLRRTYSPPSQKFRSGNLVSRITHNQIKVGALSSGLGDFSTYIR